MRKYWQDSQHLFHHKILCLFFNYILFFYLFIFSKGIYRRTSLTSSSMGTNKQAVSTRPGPNYGAIPNICTCLNVNISRWSYYPNFSPSFISLPLSPFPFLPYSLSLPLTYSPCFYISVYSASVSNSRATSVNMTHAQIAEAGITSECRLLVQGKVIIYKMISSIVVTRFLLILSLQ